MDESELSKELGKLKECGIASSRRGSLGCGHMVRRTLGPSGIPGAKLAQLKAPAPTSNSSPNLKRQPATQLPLLWALVPASGLNIPAIAMGFGPGKRLQRGNSVPVLGLGPHSGHQPSNTATVLGFGPFGRAPNPKQNKIWTEPGA